MTSYEWQPGNVYGQYSAPEYNAITYTWGRWRLMENEQPSVRSIGVSGVPWLIPRVKPERFTAEELEQVIRQSTGGLSTLKTYRNKDLPTVEFIWIDIICIDQRGNSPTSASEIGRQALIFDGAKHVVAWLSTFSSQELGHTLKELNETATRLEQNFAENRILTDAQSLVHLDNARAHFHRLFADTWFTSLWTLQEAYLRYDALLMSREGLVASSTSKLQPASGVPIQADLWEILQYCEQIQLLKHKVDQSPYSLNEIMNMIQDSGMQALLEVSALAVYLAAGRRQFSELQDSVYGIQQIFGARVGNTAPRADPTRRWALDDLQIQLGLHLLRNHPVLSQTHVFTAPAPLGKAWIINRSTSIIPPNQKLGAYLSTPAARDVDPDNPIEIPRSILSIKRVKGDVWGHFNGPYCSFGDFHKVFTELARHEVLASRLADDNLVTVFLDVTPEWSRCLEYRSTEYALVPAGPRQDHLSHWLSTAFSPGELGVLLVGQRNEPGANGREMFFGLLLLRRGGRPGSQSSVFHRRIGFCVWNRGHLVLGGEYLQNAKLMTGVAPLWKKNVGIFG
jgi:hypothetical protein